MEKTEIHGFAAHVQGPPVFEEVFAEHYEPVLRALFLLTGDPFEAEDLAQEAFVRIYERRERLSSSGNVAGYVYRTAVNVYRSRLRRVRMTVRRLGPPRPRDGGDRFDAIDDRDELRRAIADLSRGEREALVLVEWVGMSDREAGEVLGTSPGAVRTRISRAKGHLRPALSEGADHDD
jgi:RNA polymerase sigma-70 factor (ECF subfamily)